MPRSDVFWIESPLPAHGDLIACSYRAQSYGEVVGRAIVNGRTYTATSRMAPANDISRQLVAVGVPDAPMQVYTAGLKGRLVWRSFHKAAERTIEENAQVPVRSRRYSSA